MLKAILVTIAALIVFDSTAWAGLVVLKNGDRLTGEILEFDGEKLSMKTEFVGTVEVQWDSIEQIDSESPLYLTLKDNQLIVGPVSGTSGAFEVETRDTGRVRLAKEVIVGVRSEEEHVAYETELDRLRNPGVLDLWRGMADLGISLARGNSDTTTVNLAINADRTTTRDKISVYATSLYATNSTRGEKVTTANAIRGGARYDLNLAERHFAFGFGDLETDEFQQLDLRTTLGGGYGWHAVKNDRATLDILGGATLNREFFSTGLDRTSGEILAGQHFTFKLNQRTSFHEGLTYLPNLSESGAYRLIFTAGANTALSSWLSWTLGFDNRYLSNPLPGNEKNDLILTTGLRINFGR